MTLDWEPVLRIVTDGCGKTAVVLGDTNHVVYEPIEADNEQQVKDLVSWVGTYLLED